MVAAQQHVGHGHASKDPGPRVLRIFQPTRRIVRFLGQALGVAQDARDVADHGIDYHHGRHLAAVAHKIADRQLKGPQSLTDALVKALITATQ